MDDVAKCRREMARLKKEFAKFKQRTKKLRAEFQECVGKIDAVRDDRIQLMESA